MIKFITAFLLFRGLAWCQESEPHSGSLVQEDVRKHNWSFGFFDDRTGLSLIGYTYNLRQTDKNEIFKGCNYEYAVEDRYEEFWNRLYGGYKNSEIVMVVNVVKEEESE